MAVRPYGHTVFMPTFEGDIASSLLLTSPSRFRCPNQEGQHTKDLEFKVQGSKATQIKAEEQASARHFRGTPHAALSPVSLYFV